MWKIKQPIATDLATGGSHEITSFYRVGGTAFLVGKATEKSLWNGASVEIFSF